MTTGAVQVTNKTGLHARPAVTLCMEASKYKSDIRIKNVDKDSPEVNAKSTVCIMTIGASQGATVQISASGEDEEAAVSALIALIEGGFGEQ